jgi:small subunit ribosomal protein SAe
MAAVISPVLALKEEDVKLMLTAGVHIGTKFCDPNMERYTFKRKHDGTYILNLGKTWEKLLLAARAIVTIENPSDVIVISGRTWGQRAVFKFAQHTGSQYVAGRYTPGTFTNQIQKKFIEPRLVIVTDPISDHQPVDEASRVNVPVIAFTSSDAPLSHVDIAIPCNNKSKTSVALLYWLLAREVLRMRSLISRSAPWGVPVDLFVYRDPEQAEKEAKEAAAAAEAEGAVEDAPESKVAEWDGAGTEPAANVYAPAATGGAAAAGAGASPSGGEANPSWARATPGWT